MEETIPIPELDGIDPPANIPADQVHDFYRGKLQQIRNSYSGLVNKLAQASLNAQSMTNLVEKLQMEKSEMEAAFGEMELSQEALREQLTEADAIQAQLVNELSKAQDSITLLSSELQAAKGLLTDTLIDIEVALEKAGPPLDNLDPDRLRDVDSVIKQAGNVRRRLEEVTSELSDMRNRLRPQPHEILQMQEASGN